MRSLILNNSDALLTIVTAKDANIKTAADFKGKRVAWVVGAPSLNQNITALLAFAGLTWNDVKKVEFGGFGQAMDGIINNQVDAAFSSTISGQCLQDRLLAARHPLSDLPAQRQGRLGARAARSRRSSFRRSAPKAPSCRRTTRRKPRPIPIRC